MRKILPLRKIACMVLCLGLLVPQLAYGRSLSLIRDAEIERTIKSFAAPLLQAAGLGPNSVTFLIVNDSTLNAFATSEMRIFVNTGLILGVRDPGELKGVLAHEIGHIAGGHLIRLQDELEQASITSLLGVLAGAAIGVAAGRPDVSGALVLGANQVAQRNLLSFTRTQESSADAFAMRILDATGQSSVGMLKFFDVLKSQEALHSDNQDAYVRTHPLTQDRIDALQLHVDSSPYNSVPSSAEDIKALTLSRAKLFAFQQPLSVTLRTYPPEKDRSIAGRYAQAIAYYRAADLGRALPLMDGLISEDPDNPYFHELRGQMLFENQRLPEAKQAYEKAVRLAPTEPLILVALAHVNVELGDKSSLEEAKTLTRAALALEPDNYFAWLQMANAYGKTGDESMASYAMAEMALTSGKPAEALFHAKKALQGIKKGSPQWLQLQDVIAQAERLQAKQKKEQ